MKKYILIAAVAILSGFNLVGALSQPTSANLGNMGCQSLAGCSGGATCNSPGQASGCGISCNNGATIVCPRE